MMRYFILGILMMILAVGIPTVHAEEESTMDKVVTMAEEPLKMALVEIVNSATAAKNFIVAEIPDVIQQLLAWHFWSSLLTSLIALLITPGLFYFSYRCYKAENKHDRPWVDISFESLACITSAIVGGFSLIPFFCVPDLQWLQIWIAPKVWLIEYAAQLVK